MNYYDTSISNGGGHILLASNDQKDLSMLRGHFEASGYAVDHCDTLRDVYMTDLSGYSMVLLDLSDNIDEGIHAIESIKRGNPTTAETPVLVYSTTRRSDVLVNALNAGADDYVIKPFSLRELSARVRAVLRSTRRG